MCDSKKQPISQKCLPMIFDYKKHRFIKRLKITK